MPGEPKEGRAVQQNLERGYLRENRLPGSVLHDVIAQDLPIQS